MQASTRKTRLRPLSREKDSVFGLVFTYYFANSTVRYESLIVAKASGSPG